MKSITNGSITANYSDNIDESIANDIVQIIQKSLISYPNDLFYNLGYPSLSFDLTKFNDEIGYQIALKGYRSVSDTYLECTKSIYDSLQKKYKVSIVFLDPNGKTTLQYSKRGYWLTMLENNLFKLILLPCMIIGALMLLNYLSTKLPSTIGNETILQILQEALPGAIGFLVSVVAFKAQPMTVITKIITCFIIITTVFLYYIFTGNGLWSSLILLILFILKSIQNSLA